MQLGFDLWQLSGLLWLTGGITNPFSILFLAPVVTAATTLSRWVVLALGAMALTLSFTLVFFHQPLPWSPAGSFDLPHVFKIGIWMAIFVGSIFTSLYAWRTTNESRKMAFALAATEARLAEEQKLTALGGLAAAAAHELGTPLATIQVVAKEMSREVEPNSSLSEDAALILSQSQRCRDILEQLSQRGDYVSTRKRARTAGGLGLGVFISGRLIERTGGTVSYANSPLGGARIIARWPRDRLSSNRLD